MAVPETKTRQAMNIYNNEARSCNHCCSGKAISITYAECVFVASFIQHAMHMCHLSSVACLALQYFSTLLHNWQDFRKKVIENKMCVLIFSTTCVWNISHSKMKWKTFDKKCIWGLMWSIHYSCPILMKLEFCRRIFKNIQISSFMKIRPVGRPADV